ncbi:MAG TPA: GrpB family protein [Verrucomicrobiae bacterium]|nr:GrpB family protein [Verrucomicrobiae bacterium]
METKNSSNPSRRYEIVPYNPVWRDMFAAEAAKLKEILGSTATAVEHVGSTSIPGMSGKPLIDILIITNDITAIDSKTPALEIAGYISYGDILQSGGRLFAREKGHEKVANIHCYEPGNFRIKELRAVRDYLIAHPKEALGYASIKKQLKEQYPEDYASYRRLKDEYMDTLHVQAYAWYDSQA